MQPLEKGRLAATLGRWNQKDKTGMLMFGTSVLFGFLLPLMIYGITAVMMYYSTTDDRIMLLTQIQEVLAQLSFAAFYAGLFAAILTRVAFWKNLLSLLAPVLARTAYAFFLNWAVLTESSAQNPNAAQNRLILFAQITAFLLPPLIFMLLGYLGRLFHCPPKWANLGLMILVGGYFFLTKLFTSQRVLITLADGSIAEQTKTVFDITACAQEYGQSAVSYGLIYGVTAVLSVLIGFFLFRTVKKELEAPVTENWMRRSPAGQPQEQKTADETADEK